MTSGGVATSYVYDNDGRITEYHQGSEAAYYTYGMYYLQSRYYMPSFCRFLNADIPDIALQSKAEINGLNLFAYCNNDEVG